MIRISKENDLENLVRIWLDASIIAHDFIPAHYWEGKVTDMRTVYLPASKVHVYEIGTTIVGFIAMVDDYIAALFVDPIRQGQGVGKKLIDFVKNEHPVLRLGVYAKNTKSIGFYKKQGFMITGTKEEENTGEMETTMQWV